MRVRVVGAGSIGLLFAGCLARTDAVVEIVARTEKQAEAIARYGIRVCGEGEEIRSFPGVSASGEAVFQPVPEPDWIVLAVKQKDITEEFAEGLRRMAGGTSRVLCLQNGIGHAERLALRLPASGIYSAVTTEGALKQSDHEVKHTGRGLTLFGKAFAQGPAESGGAEAEEGAVQGLLKILSLAGFAAEMTNYIQKAIWDKLIISSVINPLTALLRIKNGMLPANENSRLMMRALYDEAFETAVQNGTAPDPGLWERLLDVCARTSANDSSMLQDILAGRLTEIEWINGSMLQAAERLKLNLPVQTTVFHLIKALESSAPGAEGEAHYRGGSS